MLNILDARKQLGLSQSEFAKLFDISSTYVSQMERGMRAPSKHLEKIIEARLENSRISPSAPISVRDINGDGNAVGHNVNASPTAPALDVERLLALAENQQKTIALQQSTIDRLVALTERLTAKQ